ncbi:hypothetical protein BV25DRAFT_225572 [Artomyces pyxidatus]|uniref:Uncharacterized protein n=1 Tax=Artomyces pyxidatus TaxID=48021 RepID=A0ACB8SGH2_9AGAM|nr:hypothetical protein BV25DRAFT_225572 [Artomyces pyxidatus]
MSPRNARALLDLGPYAFNPRRHPDGPMLSDGVFEREESELSVHMGGLHADVSFGVGLLDIDGEYEVDTDMNAGAPMWAFGADQVDVGGGTIDPSMLGGLPPPTTAPDEDLSPMHTPPYRHHSLSPTGSSSPDVPLGPMIKKSKSVATVVESPSLARPKKKKLVREEEESIAGPSSGPGSYLDYDKEVLGLHLDNTDDEDFQPRTSSRPKKSTEKVRLMRGSPSLPVADRSSSPVRKKPKAKKVRDELDLSQRPLTTEESYCHQCRNKTYRPKMDCGECPKLFCDRCIDMRYPDITFNEHAIRCPACLNICNCTACSRRRGEEYVSMRGDGWRQRWGPASVQRGAPSQDPTTQISAASIPLPLNDGVYFGAVFSIDGRRMGTAYAAGGDRVVIASSTPAPGGGQDGAGVGDNAGGGPHTVEATQTGTSPTAERGQTGLSTEELETDVPPPVEVTSVAEAGTLALASGAVKMVRRRNKTVAHHFVGKKQKGWGSCSLLRDGIKTFGNKTKATPKIRLYIGDTPPRKLKIAPASPYTFADPPSPSSSELTPIDDDDDGVWPGEVPMEDVFMGVVKPPLDFVGEPDMNGGGAFAVDAISGQTVQKFTAEDLDKVLLAVQSVH